MEEHSYEGPFEYDAAGTSIEMSGTYKQFSSKRRSLLWILVMLILTVSLVLSTASLALIVHQKQSIEALTTVVAAYKHKIGDEIKNFEAASAQATKCKLLTDVRSLNESINQQKVVMEELRVQVLEALEKNNNTNN